MSGTKRTSIWRFLRAFWYFFKHYSFTAIIINVLLIPLFSWLGAAILRWSDIPYLSYTNFVSVAQVHPFAMLSLLGLLILILVAIYFQFAYLLLMVAYRRKEQRPTIRQLLAELGRRLPRFSPMAFGFYLLYFILIVPFGGNFISTPLLAKVQIPEFIVEFILTKPVLLTLLMLVYALAFYFGLRLLLAIPILLFEPTKSVRQAVKESWQRTWGRFWWVTLRIVGIIVSIAILYGIVVMGFFVIQTLFDEFQQHLALGAALVNFNLLTLANYTIQILATVWVLDLSIQVMLSYDQHALDELPDVKRVHSALWWRISIPVVAVVVAGLFAGYGYFYYSGMLAANPQTLSHRGVDDGNGVQNTIQALTKTHREHPKYVEIDIQETKDKQFVVMHDPDLNNLAGQNRVVHKQTLASLTDVTIHENGHQTKIDSFDSYLAKARQLHQHLLIEIKISPSENRRELVNNFINKYADGILANHDIIHSLDYGVVEQLKTKQPKLKVGYILPYNFVGLPHTKADFYTMEYTTLNERFVNEAHQANKQVFAWTVNDESAMDKVMDLDVDGIITDQLTTLNQQIKAQRNDHNYADELLQYGLSSIQAQQQ